MRSPVCARFEGKAVIITGAASGIGAQTALDFAREGASVALLDAQAERGAGVVAEIRRNGGRALFFRTDVTSSNDVAESVGGAFEAFGEIDFLVQCAGVLRDALLEDVTEELWDTVLNVNAKGTLFTAQAVVKRWLAAAAANPKEAVTEHPDRRIINVSSLAADAGQAGQTCYAASKAAVIAMSKSWSKELWRYNIRCHVVVPALIDTPMVSGLLQKDGAKWKRAFEEVMPFGIGKPSYISDAILFLCSDEFYFANGEVLRVNGGKLGSL
jgi:NAD(P)-dependent dehydrogenase (short-subunit alcohol dehydrogenase family)